MAVLRNIFMTSSGYCRFTSYNFLAGVSMQLDFSFYVFGGLMSQSPLLVMSRWSHHFLGTNQYLLGELISCPRTHYLASVGFQPRTSTPESNTLSTMLPQAFFQVYLSPIILAGPFIITQVYIPLLSDF